MKKLMTVLIALAFLPSCSSIKRGGSEGQVKIPLSDKGGALEFDWEVIEGK